MHIASRAVPRRRLAALVALFALALLAGQVTPVAAGGTGTYGAHSHAISYCTRNNSNDPYSGRMTVNGARAYSNRSYLGANDPGNRVYFQAYLYKWNGSTWAYNASSPWQQRFVRGTDNVSFSSYFPSSGSGALSAGYYKAATRLIWYDAANGSYMGESPVSWVDQHYRVNFGPTTTITKVSYCTFPYGLPASATTARNGEEAKDAGLPEPPPAESGQPTLPKGKRGRPDRLAADCDDQDRRAAGAECGNHADHQDAAR